MRNLDKYRCGERAWGKKEPPFYCHRLHGHKKPHRTKDGFKWWYD